MTVGEAANVLDLAHSCLLKVAANLCFVVGVHRANIMSTGVLGRHGLRTNKKIENDVRIMLSQRIA